VPVTAEWNIGFLKQSGFSHIDCTWRWMNFAAWVAIK
jgi:tRNA (cmo5U34)-methyltransferase